MAINPYYSSSIYYGYPMGNCSSLKERPLYPELDKVYYQPAAQHTEPLHENSGDLMKIEYSVRNSEAESQSLKERPLYPELDKVYYQSAAQPTAQLHENGRDLMKIDYTFRDSEVEFLSSMDKDTQAMQNTNEIPFCYYTEAEAILNPPDFIWGPSETTGSESGRVEKSSSGTEEKMVDDDYRSGQEEESDPISQASDETEVLFCQVCGTETTPLWKEGPKKGLLRWREGPNGSRLCDNDYSSYRKMLVTNPARAKVQYQLQLHSLEEARREQQRRQAKKLVDLNFRQNPFCQFCGTTESEKFTDTQVVGFLCKPHYKSYGYIRRKDPKRARKAFAPKYFTIEEALVDREAIAQREEKARQKTADLVFRKNPFCQYCGTTNKSLRYLNTHVVGYLCFPHYNRYSELKRRNFQLAVERYTPQYFTLQEAAAYADIVKPVSMT